MTAHFSRRAQTAWAKAAGKYPNTKLGWAIYYFNRDNEALMWQYLFFAAFHNEI